MDIEQYAMDRRLLQSLQWQNITQLTTIQTQAWEHLREPRNALLTAPTGSGKTLAYLLPVLDQCLRQGGGRKTRAIIITPTRELARQVYAIACDLLAETRLRCSLIIGGESYWRQRRDIYHAGNILIATPGRLLDFVQQQRTRFRHIETVIFDEVDALFEDDFFPDVLAITESIPTSPRYLFSSATATPQTHARIKLIADNYIHLDAQMHQPNIQHCIYTTANSQDKSLRLSTMLFQHTHGQAIIFTKSKHQADKVAEQLEQEGYASTKVHSALHKRQRRRNLRSMREAENDILIATDLCARGIDLDNVSQVIHYDLPNSPEAYIHRAGRTARNGKSGTSVSFVTPGEEAEFKAIEARVGQKFKILS